MVEGNRGWMVEGDRGDMRWGDENCKEMSWGHEVGIGLVTGELHGRRTGPVLQVSRSGHIFYEGQILLMRCHQPQKQFFRKAKSRL